jgi:hypothetical protein
MCCHFARFFGELPPERFRPVDSRQLTPAAVVNAQAVLLADGEHARCFYFYVSPAIWFHAALSIGSMARKTIPSRLWKVTLYI